jgi:hypothetical protein
MAAIKSPGGGRYLGASEPACQEHPDSSRRQNCRGAVSGEALHDRGCLDQRRDV